MIHEFVEIWARSSRGRPVTLLQRVNAVEKIWCLGTIVEGDVKAKRRARMKTVRFS